jgi:hypothetical protein
MVYALPKSHHRATLTVPNAFRNLRLLRGSPIILAALMLTAYAAAPRQQANADELAGMAEAGSSIRAEFQRLDLDADRKLRWDEFRSIPGDPRVRQRDFRLYDFDESGFLTQSEFACVSGLVEPHLRGTMPDPIDVLVEDAVAALDESYDHWDRRPQELVSAHTFVSNFLASISPGRKRFVTGRIIGQADRDADGRVSRTEAREFLEQQLGVRLRSGPPLREATGRVVRYDRFLATDDDRNGVLTRSEFIRSWWNPASASQDFDSADRDGNGHVTFEEYAHPRSNHYFDPVEWFRHADQDMDARLSGTELAASTEPERKHLVMSTLRAFDTDGDELLTLHEYRASMLASYNYPWHRRPPDQDRDGELSYDEFAVDLGEQFQLQRWYFFHRLDANRDGRLSLAEFAFRPLEPVSIWAFATSGKSSRLLYRSPEFPECGWPSISPDGSQLLLHQIPLSGPVDSQIVSVSLDGDHVRVLGKGIRPSWSPDGDFFVCERRSRDAGIWIIDAGGRSGRRISAGSAPRWSPDGRSIAFLKDNGVSIYDLETDESRTVLLREDHPYQDLGNDVAWSPDGMHLAVLGNFAATSQLLIVSSRGPQAGEVRVRYSFDTALRGQLHWTAGNSILLGVRDAKSGEITLLRVETDGENSPKPVDQFSEISGVRSACVTPDGQWYVAVVEQ